MQTNRRIFLKNTGTAIVGASVCPTIPGISNITSLSDGQMRQQPWFKPTKESLLRYKCPDWFRDAKFGIWAHWGPQCVPMAGGWYARSMYMEGSSDYNHHIKNYGHPSEFGFKDIIELWKAEKFDAEELMKLFKGAGAKFFIALANHHDNFDLWNSVHHEWNSVRHGPHKDIVGMFRNAAIKENLRFGVTEHCARSYSWFQTNKGADKKGPKAGIPYDGNNPDYQSLYHQPDKDDNSHTPRNPPESWRKEWLMRTKDLIDSYQPDLLYLDGAIPFYGDDQGKTGMDLISYFYNQNMKWHDGHPEAVMCTKYIKDHGIRLDGATTQDVERGRLADISEDPWECGTSIGPWFYKEGHAVRPVGDVVKSLIDIVSKNGTMLLNIPQSPDGRISSESKKFLEEMGEWMRINGDALYGTRPWLVYGEGPTNEKMRNLEIAAEHNIRDRDTEFKAGDIRFASHGDKELSVFLMGWPQNGRTFIHSLAKTNKLNPVVEKVEMYGHSGKLNFVLSNKGLEVELPSQKPCKYAYVLKVSGKNLR